MAEGLKVKASMDNSELKKGFAEASKNIKDFEKTSSGALNALGDALGVNVGKIEEFGRAFSGAASTIATQAGASKSAIAAIGAEFAALGSVAGVAIAGIVAGFKTLNSYAEHYTSTVQGAALASSTKAYIDTYKSFMSDLGPGKEAAEAKSQWQKFWGTLGARFKDFIRTGAFTGDAGLGQTFQKDLDDASEKAQKAAKLQAEITDAQIRQIGTISKVAEIQNRINELQVIMRDDTYSVNEQLAAAGEIQDLIHEKYNIQKDDQYIIANNIAEINKLSNSTPEALKAAEQEMSKFNMLTAQENAEIAALTRRLNSLRNKGTGTTTTQGDRSYFTADNMLPAVSKSLAEAQAVMLENPLKIKFDFDQARKDVMIAAEDINSILWGAAQDVAGAFGAAIGNALSGGQVNIGAELLDMVGGVLVKFGELAMAAGAASEGIKESLNLKNPYVAIAAGAALIALGSAVSAAASNLANSNSYSSSSVASSYRANGATSDYNTNSINVNVTGTLQASGSTLVAVINNENKRKNLTT